MSAERHYFSIYFDSAAQKQRFRELAARAGVSMAELGKQTLIKAHNLPTPPFLTNASNETDERLSSSSDSQAA